MSGFVLARTDRGHDIPVNAGLRVSSRQPGPLAVPCCGRHRHLTVIADHDRDGAVLWAEEGKPAPRWRSLFEQMGRPTAPDPPGSVPAIPSQPANGTPNRPTPTRSGSSSGSGSGSAPSRATPATPTRNPRPRQATWSPRTAALVFPLPARPRAMTPPRWQRHEAERRRVRRQHVAACG